MLPAPFIYRNYTTRIQPGKVWSGTGPDFGEFDFNNGGGTVNADKNGRLLKIFYFRFESGVVELTKEHPGMAIRAE